MSRTHIRRASREKIRSQAKHHCGYCLSAEVVVGMPMEIDHIIPEALGGLTEEDNLWLACPLCNEHKGDRVAAIDPTTGDWVSFFDPRHQLWREHFVWSQGGERVIGLTATGRATVLALNLNRPALVAARQRWVEVGWHPPGDV